jgi:hypothetical protein
MSLIRWLVTKDTTHSNSFETSGSRQMTGIKMFGTLSFGVRMISREPSSGVFE